MRVVSITLSAVVLAVAALGTGCMDADPEPAALGSVEIPLVQQTNGNLYRLNASFRVTGPDGKDQIIDGNVDAPDVTVNVTPGIVTIEILDGWTLTRSTDGGATFTPVSAVLATTNPVNLIVNPNQTAFWDFEFIIRDATTELHITFGVNETAHQLSGLLFINGGFGAFAPYSNTQISVAIYFTSFSSTSVEEDGTHDRQYFSSTSAVEFFNDTLGLLAPVAADFTGGFLNLTTRVHPDGTQDISGNDSGFGQGFAQLTLGTGTMFGSVDQDGFPADDSFFAFNMPFVISSNSGVILTGSVETLDHSIRQPH